MGIPYSKEINIAFAQVTPLVAAGFEVLQTTKNISILLAAVQILTTILLSVILLTLVALICVVNPDLERERDALVTPVVRWLAGWVLVYGNAVAWTLRVGVVAAVSAFLSFSALGCRRCCCRFYCYCCCFWAHLLLPGPRRFLSLRLSLLRARHVGGAHL